MTKILLVDDEPDIVEFLKYNLEQNGYEVIVGQDGFQALKKLSENPDLIILDIMMPHLDGYEVYHKIREKKIYGCPDNISNSKVRRNLWDKRFGNC